MAEDHSRSLVEGVPGVSKRQLVDDYNRLRADGGGESERMGPREMPRTFLVMETLNPLDHEGSSSESLRTAQADRFVMKLILPP